MIIDKTPRSRKIVNAGKLVKKTKKVENKIKKSKIIKIDQESVERLALNLCQKYEQEFKDKKFFRVKNILNLIGSGVLSLTEFSPSNIIRLAKPFIQDLEAYESWKRFNIPYLKRTIRRLEKQKVVEISEEKGKQIIKITDKGRIKILKNAIDDLKIERPSFWDRKWWLVSYDLPEDMSNLRDGIRRYLLYLGFFPFHKSVYLHAYPCRKEIEFLREYFGIGEYMKIFKIEWIENDRALKEFFNL